jgi:hypothetical protein
MGEEDIMNSRNEKRANIAAVECDNKRSFWRHIYGWKDDIKEIARENVGLMLLAHDMCYFWAY